MKTNQTNSALTGLLIGIIIGVVVGVGGMNMIKKSQRTPSMMFISIGIAVVILGSVGYTTGSNIGRQIDIENALGHSDANEKLVQQGRVWIAITVWVDKRNNTEYTLITGQTETKILITQLNDVAVYNHEIKSGSNQNVSKFHKWSRNQLFEKQKWEYKD